jgi:hypothetical protein
MRDQYCETGTAWRPEPKPLTLGSRIMILMRTALLDALTHFGFWG